MADESLAKIEKLLDHHQASPETPKEQQPRSRVPGDVKHTDSIVSRTLPEIRNYKTNLPGWTSDDSSSSSPAMSPAHQSLGSVGGVASCSLGESQVLPLQQPRKRSLLDTTSREPKSPIDSNSAIPSIIFKAQFQQQPQQQQSAQAEAQHPKTMQSLSLPPPAAAGGEQPEKRKGPPPNIEPKPKLSRADRRAVQEQQRAEKEAKKTGGAPPPKPAGDRRASGAPAPTTTAPLAPSKVASPALRAAEAPDAAAAAGKKGSNKSPGKVDVTTAGPTSVSAPSPRPSSVASTPSLKSQPAPNEKQSTKASTSSSAAASTPSASSSAPSFRQNPSMFSHLPPHSSLLTPGDFEKRRRKLGDIHPATVRLGLKLQHGHISGANSRVLALIHLFRELIRDYQLPQGEQVRHDLGRHINQQVSYLVLCRPLVTAMGHCIKHVKQAIISLPAQIPIDESRKLLNEELDLYVLEKITTPRVSIVKNGTSCVNSGDVILTFLTSDLIQQVLQTAASQNKKFRVVVVDTRPQFEGEEIARSLSESGIEVQYAQLHAVCYVMQDVTKVFLSADSLLSNGNVYARSGTSLVATVAHQFKVPVIVVCETYKFSLSGRLDSIVANELGNPDELVSDVLEHGHDALHEWKDMHNLKLLNLTYDLTPIRFVQMVVTDAGLIPPTSVPVVLREYQKQT